MNVWVRGFFIIYFSLFGGFACSGGEMSVERLSSEGRSPAGSSGGLYLKPTIYYQPVVNKDNLNCSSNSLRDLLSPDGRVLETICEYDYKACITQGTCTVHSQGKITAYNYHSQKEGRSRFMVVDLSTCPFGYGARSTCLDPYFSVAADLNIYKLGDVIFVKKLVGVRIPTSEVHDGFLIIRDSGGGIVGPGRFDFYTGYLNYLNKANTLAQLGFGDPKNRIEYRMATPEEAQAVRLQRNFPRIKN